MRALIARLAAAALALAVVAGCGEAEPPAQAAPAIADRLEAVDAAVARADYPRAQTALDALVKATTEARDAGRIEDDQAQAILDAAGVLEDRLPAAEEPQEAPSEEPADEETSPTPTPTPTEDDSGDDDSGDDEKAREDAEKAREQAEKEAEREAKKQEKEEEKDD